jgi:hypothetical protein
LREAERSEKQRGSLLLDLIKDDRLVVVVDCRSRNREWRLVRRNRPVGELESLDLELSVSLIVEGPVDEIDEAGVAVYDGCAENAEGRVDVMGVNGIMRIRTEGTPERSRLDVRGRIDVEGVGLVAHREEEEHVVLLAVLH